MTRNKALRAIQARVAQRERDVIEAAMLWCQSDAGPQIEAADQALHEAVDALRDARALLSEATETAQ